MTNKESIICASRYYLSDELPSDFDQMKEDDLNEFIISHTWSPFEGWDVNDISALIEDLALEFETLTNKQGK